MIRGLESLYPSALLRAERVYPASIQPVHILSHDVRSVTDSEERPVAGELMTNGAHLTRRLSDDAGLTNGATVRWMATDRNSLRVARGRYFDMIASCDAMRAEAQESGDVLDTSRNPLRAAVHRACGDPLASGLGRSAAIGVSVILTVPRQDSSGSTSRAFVIGRRTSQLVPSVPVWHVAPSGMLEWAEDGKHLGLTTEIELREELGIVLPSGCADRRLLPLGIVHDLLMLKPDLVVRLDLELDEVPEMLHPISEFDRLDFVPLDREALAEFWKMQSPTHLVPAAAGAIALLETTLPA